MPRHVQQFFYFLFVIILFGMITVCRDYEYSGHRVLRLSSLKALSRRCGADMIDLLSCYKEGAYNEQMFLCTKDPGIRVSQQSG